jgi:signal transduction histidine kinase
VTLRSIFAKIVLWSLGTFALALVGFWVISHTIDRHGPGEGDPFRTAMSMVEDDIYRAYEQGGSEGLATQLKRLDAYLPGEHFLTDASGRDLVTGVNRSELLRPGRSRGGPPRLPDGRMVLMSPKRGTGGRYRFITVVKPWFERSNQLPYNVAIVLVIAGMAAILAAHLVAPLGRLRRVVDSFGQGDLTARVGSTRKDEIGELSRAFDEMAGRIETLMAAERQLLQDVSHELRSPLARLDVAVDLALTSDDRGKSLGRIKRDIGRLSVLVNELLQLTRAEGDPSELDREEVRLDDLLRGLVEDCALEAEAKGCRLILREVEPCSVGGERELLHRAVENLVRNAIRHTSHGTEVDVSLELHEGSATIEVRDHGPGVPDEFLAAIFQPFFRVEGHRSRASGGVGLGLAIARRAVELHGGRISAANANPGLVVSIHLPHAQAEVDQTEIPLSPEGERAGFS